MKKTNCWHPTVMSDSAVVRLSDHPDSYLRWPRCRRCGHRVTWGGITPRRTRTYKPHIWLLELWARGRARYISLPSVFTSEKL